jgi:hypothetical protein
MIMDEHQDELRATPILRGSSRRDAFKVPAGFFDRFPNQVQSKVLQDQRPKRFLGLWPERAFRIAVLGAFTLLVGLGLWMRPTTPVGSATTAELGEVIHPEELLELEMEDDILFATLAEDGPVLNTVALALSEKELTAYVEFEDLSLELLIEEL